MAITLQVLPQHIQQSLKLISSAINNTPQFGGPAQRVSRMGDRYQMDVTTRSLMYADAAALIADLTQGTSQKVLCPVQQPGLVIGSTGNPVVSSGSGSTLNLTGFAANYPIRKGQFFSLVHGGKRYLHYASAAATANASGVVALSIWPMLRTTVSGGDVCEFAVPKIEGFLSDTSWSWSVGIAQTVGLTFSIVEST